MIMTSSIPVGRRQWQPTLVLLSGESHGWRNLVGYSPWGCKELNTTERLHFHFSLSCIGEGNGNPLQYSCLENPRDRGACWAAVCGVAQSRTRLKRLSSSSSSILYWCFSFWLTSFSLHQEITESYNLSLGADHKIHINQLFDCIRNSRRSLRSENHLSGF